MTDSAWLLLLLLFANWLGFYRFRRYRRTTVDFHEWKTFKQRLPRWVAIFEQAVRTALWIFFSIMLFLGLLILQIAVHRARREPDTLAFGLLLISSFLFMLVPSFLLANSVSWIVKPVLRANLVAMEGLRTVSLSAANTGLLKMGAVLMPIYAAVAALAVYEPWRH